MFTHDGNKTFMNYRVLKRELVDGNRIYTVSDLFENKYPETKLCTKDEIAIFLNTGI
jgi:hypothetical protein